MHLKSDSKTAIYRFDVSAMAAQYDYYQAQSILDEEKVDYVNYQTSKVKDVYDDDIVRMIAFEEPNSSGGFSDVVRWYTKNSRGSWDMQAVFPDSSRTEES